MTKNKCTLASENYMYIHVFVHLKTTSACTFENYMCTRIWKLQVQVHLRKRCALAYINYAHASKNYMHTCPKTTCTHVHAHTSTRMSIYMSYLTLHLCVVSYLTSMSYRILIILTLHLCRTVSYLTSMSHLTLHLQYVSYLTLHLQLCLLYQ